LEPSTDLSNTISDRSMNSRFHAEIWFGWISNFFASVSMDERSFSASRQTFVLKLAVNLRRVDFAIYQVFDGVKFHLNYLSKKWGAL
jgi:hypothetical protein